MKFYLAGRYGRREELYGIAAMIEGMGHTVTSRWVRGEHEAEDGEPQPALARRWAEEDLADIEEADVLVAFTEEPDSSAPRASRGGRHVELGYALGIRKAVYLVGPRENVFCHSARVFQFCDVRSFLEVLEQMFRAGCEVAEETA